MKSAKINEIVILHCIGVLMIFFGHIAQVVKQYAIGEILITGVPLFLFMSGYLTGLKKQLLTYDWLKRKIVRILTPYYLILFVVFITCLLVYPKATSILQWIVLFCDLQGFTNFLFLNDTLGYYSPLSQGLGHFWYVTIIMVCYLIIMVVDRIYNSTVKLRTYSFASMLCIILILQPLLLYYNLHINYIVIFIVGWLVARRKLKLDNTKFILLTILTITFFAIRIIASHRMDNTLIYEKYIAVLASDMIGLWIFAFLFYLGRKLPALISRIANMKAVIYLESIIYEFFLIHHIIVKGDWSVFNCISNPAIATIVAFIATILFSIILHTLTNRISKSFSI